MKSKHINSKLIHLFSKASQILMVFVTIFSMVFTGWQPASAAPMAALKDSALQFDGTNDYVTFGSSIGEATGLGVRTFTIETWFKKTGTGATTSTGTGGVTAIPLVTKGRGEGENSNVDMNYFFGLDATGHLVADFEECAPAMTGCPAGTPGLNHPVTGTAFIANDTWYHAAVTYDGRVWNLYLNGVLDKTLDLGSDRLPRWDSIQHAGLGTAMTSTGATAGFFAGVMDEVRIWNVVRTQTEIFDNMNAELTSGTGLIGRWGLNEGAGLAANNSIAGRPNGTLTNGPLWLFPPDTTPPAAPTALTASPYNGGVSLNWTAPADLDVAGYNVYRATSPSVPLTSPVNGGTLVTGTSYNNPGLTNGTTYYYVVTAVDTSTNQSPASNEINTTPLVSLGSGLAFDGINDYVTFGPTLNVTNFTLEAWVKRAAGGATMTTGSLGLDGTSGRPLAYPVLTKGMGEGETPANINMNYFLGITQTGMVGADFEDAAGGVNHPAWGTTTIPVGGWHHIAATYNGSCWALYLDGNLETLNNSVTGCPNAVPEFTSIQHAGLAAGIGSTGQLSTGFFSGVIDEARIWNVARTQTEIRSTINDEITSGSGLVARWGINEGSGTSIASSVGSFPGTLTAGPAWSAGSPFNIFIDITPPGAPTNLMASAQPGQVLLEWTANTESDLAGYRVYRSTSSPVTIGTPLNSALLLSPAFVDQNVTAGTTYHYAVSAVDTFGNESGLSGEVNAIPLPPPPAEALRLGSGQAYVALGDNADVPEFTLETWLRRDGAGTAVSSGTGGVTLVPVIANGTAEAESVAADVNYFFGIQDVTNVLCADFEEAQTGASPSLNHPVCGTTPLVNNTWYHVAATYDGSTWRLYLNGNLDATLSVGRPANIANTAPLAFGTSLKTDSTTNGFFNGVLDEVRIWDYARSQAQIASTINAKLTTPQTGLIGRWGLDEASGSVAGDSSGSGFDGTITGTGYSWVAGSPFSTIVNLPPDAPELSAPANNATNVSTPVTLSVNVSDPENAPLNVTFYGRPIQAAAGPDFTIAVIPDAQYYAASFPAIYNAQMQWIADNKTSNNIVYAASLGDNVDVSSNTTQWTRADAAYDILEAANVPYGVEAGNHDGAPTATDNFNANFGVSRFTGKPYYGGHYGTDNDNNYALFEASGQKFIVIYIEYDGAMTSSSHPVLQWANNLLATHSDRHAIVISHNLLNGGTSNTFSPQGQAIYDALKGNPNLFLMNGGHLDVASRRTDTLNGNTVFSLRSDYQSVDSQQSGYLRLLRFSPADDMIYVRTYSPTQNKDYDKSDAAQSNFTLQYPMDGVGFEAIGTATGVSSGGTASISWPGLDPSTHYEWYVVATDGTHQTSSNTWNFTTAATTYQLTVTPSGNGTVSKNPDLAAYPSGSNVTLTATPAAGWGFANWSGGATGTTNPLTITMDGNKSIMANFNQNTYSLTVTPSGSGSVSKNPDQATYLSGTSVTLTATPAAGWGFANWSGGATGTTNPLTITMDGNKSIMANFNQNTYSLTVTPSGSGSVSKNPDQATYLSGTSVTLTATPAAGWSFANWSGGATGTTNPLTITMDGNKSITANFTQNLYTLTVTTSGSGSVSKNPDQVNYLSGTSVTLTATPAAGWSFANWSGGATGTTNPLTITMDGNKSITANFNQNTYSLTVTPSGSGSVSKNPDQATYLSGTSVTLTATPAAGWSFANWSGGATGTTNPLTITMDGNKSITANFTQNSYTLTVTTSGSGSVSKNPNQPTYLSGSSVTLTATPAAGWSFANWSSGATGTTNPLTITMDGNKSITANFTQNSYTLTVTTLGSGTVSKNPDQATYLSGTSVTLTPTPAVGWGFANWSGGATGTANPLTVTMDGNKSITANFTQTVYTLTVTKTGSGTVTADIAAPYHYNDVVKLTATPDPGWSFANWTGGATGTTNPLTVTMDGNKSLTANFTQNSYTLTVTTLGSGTVSKNPDQPTYLSGTSVTLTPTPAVGWSFANWTGGATGTTNPLTVTMDGNKSITANFTQNSYTLTVTTAGSGTVSKVPDQPTYLSGTSVTLTPAPAVGWSFANWTGGATGTANPLTVTMEGNKAITANFTQNSYTLTVTTLGSGTVSKLPDQATYLSGTSVTLTPVPATGWSFANWTGGATGNANPLTITMDGNKTITANFTHNVHTLTFTHTGNGAVTADKAAPYYYGDVVKLTAIADAGWSFASWSGDITSTTNPLNVLLLANTTVNAVFTQDALDTTLLVAPATGTFGNTVNLSATLTQTVGGTPVSGRTIIFKLNGAELGSAVTNASGVAALNAASLAGIDAGSYPAGVNASFAGDASFKLSSDSDALQVNKRAITVKADPKSKLVGEIDPPLTYKLINGSLVAPDAFSGNLTRDAGETVGVYAIRQGTLALSTNYELLYQGATLTINLHPNPTISGNAGVGGASLSYGAGSPVTAAADGSYTITVPYNWSGTVTPSKANYTFTPVSKSYTNLQTNQTAQHYTAKLTIAKPAVPVTVSPIGVITDSLPTYVWKPSAGATSYWLSVYNQTKGNLTISSMVVPATVCTGTPSLCKFRPSAFLGTYTYRFSVAAVNQAGSSGYSPWAGWKIFTVRKLAAYTSIASLDGYLLESSETSGVGGLLNSISASILLGDDAKNRQYRSILSFNTSSLPDNAVIVSATLKLKKVGTQGIDPFTTHGALMVDLRNPFFGASAGLQLDDFAALASLNNAGAVGKTPVSGFYISKLAAPGLTQVNKAGFTQLRLRFLLDDDNDLTEDLLAFYSGNSVTAANRPVLEIVYYVP